MRVLSAHGSLLPSLVFRELTSDAKATLDSGLLQQPSGYVPGNFWVILGILAKLLEGLAIESMNAQDDSALKGELLGLTELLMHKISTLHEALEKSIAALSKGSSSRAMRRRRQELAAVVERHFKIPVNLIKHDNHTLQWLDAVSDSEHVSGFVVSGLIDQGLIGPASLGKKPKSVDEGYSYPRFLRDSLSDVRKDASLQTTQNKVDLVVEALNNLPHRCFPNEHGSMVSEFGIEKGSLIEIRKRRLVQFKKCRFTYTVPHLEKGGAYKMPFWQPQ
jgi:hypothetical protein